jgi:hypothetical protein
MADDIDISELRSGAMPDESIQEMGGDYGLAERQAARIAEAILNEGDTLESAYSLTGDHAANEPWDLSRHADIGQKRRPRGNRHLDGYGRKENVR